MKAVKDVENLAARLTSAANAPLIQQPFKPKVPDDVPLSGSEISGALEVSGTGGKGSSRKTSGKKEPVETTPITLRPTRQLLGRYIEIASDRSRVEGRMVSAQEIMLEVLTKGAK